MPTCERMYVLGGRRPHTPALLSRWEKNTAARPATATKPSNLLLLALDWGPEEAQRALKVVLGVLGVGICGVSLAVASEPGTEGVGVLVASV